MLVLEDGSRKRIQFTYTVFRNDNIICRDVLCYPFSSGSTRMKRLQRLARQQRCFPERHGNVGGVPWNLMSQEMRDRVIEFIRTYALVFGLQIPVAPMGRADNARTYLPASESFVTVHHEYWHFCAGACFRHACIYARRECMQQKKAF